MQLKYSRLVSDSFYLQNSWRLASCVISLYYLVVLGNCSRLVLQRMFLVVLGAPPEPESQPTANSLAPGI